MKQTIALVALFIVLAAGALLFWMQSKSHLGTPAREFLADAKDLTTALQEYRKFVGSYPSGSAVDIANALSGQNDSSKKVLVLASSLKKRNPKGEIIDPWGTPIQFYFSQGNILLRSAGPNRRFEDSAQRGSDDLFSADAR